MPGTGVDVPVGAAVVVGDWSGAAVLDGAARCVAATIVAMSSGAVLGIFVGAQAESNSTKAICRLADLRELMLSFSSVPASILPRPGVVCRDPSRPCVHIELTGRMDLVSRIQRIAAAWWPAVLIMLGIFVFSSRPSSALPNFGWADAIVKKGGHMLGFGVLALAYWRAWNWEPRRMLHALLLTLFYAGTDEFHQSFVVGRHASAADVVLFDGTGAALALWVRQSVFPHEVGEPAGR